MPGEFTYDVFLSHSAKDKRSKPPTSLDDQSGKGLERSRVLVLCMSANAFGSDWAQLESGTFRTLQDYMSEPVGAYSALSVFIKAENWGSFLIESKSVSSAIRLAVSASPAAIASWSQ